MADRVSCHAGRGDGPRGRRSRFTTSSSRRPACRASSTSSHRASPRCWAGDLSRRNPWATATSSTALRSCVHAPQAPCRASTRAPVNIPEALIRTSVRGSPDPFWRPFWLLPSAAGHGPRRRALTLQILPIPGDAARQWARAARFDLSAKLDHRTRRKIAPGERDAAQLGSRAQELARRPNRRRSDVPERHALPAECEVRFLREPAGRKCATEWSYVLVPKETAR